MRFNKLIWPIIWSSLTLSIIILSISIFCNVINVPPPSLHIKATNTTEDNLSKTNSVQLPIIMYHGLTKDIKKQNEYFISPSTFENDLQYLKDNGFTTITMAQLIEYVYNKNPLPKKPILLSFDDGFYNNYLYAYPLLKKYNQKAIISIIGSQTDRYSLIKIMNSYYSYLTWDQINEMIISGHIEIQNHTYEMHTYNNGRKGCADKTGETFETYKEIFTEDIGLLQQRITDYTGTTPNTIAYPFGHYTKNSEKVIKEMGFKASLTCCQKLNVISHNPECLYMLGRFLRPPEKSSDCFFKEILDKT